MRIQVPRSLACSQSFLCVRYDSQTQEDFSSMFWCGMEGDDYEWWECHFIPSQPGLYWYRFELATNRGRLPLLKIKGGRGAIALGGSSFQLTVYEPDFKTPDWLKGGILYQIFPDRFYKGKLGRPCPYPRRVHSTWQEEVDWKPREDGEYYNDDYYGGNLQGVADKLPYLHSLGVTAIYLNPVFESHSNHRYDTADYEKIDPLLGSEGDLARLCAAAEKYGISIILDGVFSHTGDDSVYFNRYGRYSGLGAYQSPQSPYSSWYTFTRFPEQYDCWWGFQTLPEVKETDGHFMHFICGKNGVCSKWLKAGVKGWRLDVADELPDAFLEAFYRRVKETDPQAIVLGEVWEDASNKESYQKRRSYLLGRQMDSVMNYPFRDAVLGFVTGSSGMEMMERVMTILENYPKPAIDLLMNHIGTHDTERALTVLAGEPAAGRGRDWQAGQHLSPEAARRGVALLKLASCIQYFLPGVPSLYYGDEAQMEGYRDPFNRRTYPWGGENRDLIKWYQTLGTIRRKIPLLAKGYFAPYGNQEDLFSFLRYDKGAYLICGVNRGEKALSIPLQERHKGGQSLLGPEPAGGCLTIPPLSCVVYQGSN